MSIRSIFRNIAANWVGLAANLVASFFLAPFVVNHLGATYYGVWALIMQFTGYLYLLDFGVRDSVIRYTAKYRAQRRPARLNRMLSTALMLYMPVAVGAVVICGIAALTFPVWFEIRPEFKSETQLVVLLVGLTISQTFLFNVFSGVLLGLQRFDIPNAISLAFGALRIVAIVVGLKNGMGIVGLSVVQLAIGFLNGSAEVFFALRLLRREGLAFRFTRAVPRLRSALLRQMFGYSIYVFINNMGQKIILASSALVVGAFLPMASVTYYAIAASLIDYLRSLVVMTAQVFNPLASHYSALRDHVALRSVMLRSSRLAAIIGLPVVITYVILGRDFIRLWMGESFATQAYEVLVILAIMQVFSNPHFTITSVLYGMSRHRTIAWLRVGEAVVNLTLSVTLVQKIGLVGAAIGTAIPHILMVALVLPTLACRIVGIPVARFLVSVYTVPFIAAIPFAAAATWIRDAYPAANLLVFFSQIAALMVIYVLTMYFFALSSEERDLIQTKVRGLLASA